jgi:hypothetical protein
MSELTVVVDGREFAASWTNENPKTRSAIADALPLEGRASRWGDELYFSSDVEAQIEDARETVEEGTLAYWPQGQAICLFWGPTPASTDERPRAASPVNVFARVADPSALDDVDGGARMRLSAE